jgi:protein-S-isoprenylcysteine O-methyltransferase Ste14
MPTDSGRSIPSDEPMFRHRTWVGVLVLLSAVVAELLGPARVPPGGAWAVVLGLLGWALFVAYASMRVWSILYVGGRKGRALVTDGPYAMVRNPLYLGSFLFALSSAAFLQSAIVLAAAGVLALVYRFRVIPAEERALAALLGEAFRTYAARTPRLLPRRPPPPGPQTTVLYLRGIRAEAQKLWVSCLMPPLALLLVHLRHAPWWPRVW